MKATKSLYSLLWLLLFPIVAHAGEVPGTYAKYQWDASVAGLTSVDYDITVVVYPGSRANIRWANWFRLVGSSNGGYVGMENRANGGPSFVFSVRGAMRIPPMSATHSAPCRPGLPPHAGHLFRRMSAGV